MIRFFVTTFILLFGLGTQKVLASQNFYYAGCRILDADFELVRTLSADRLCLPLPDGGWISSNNATYLKKYNAAGDEVWSLKGYYHHQFNLFNETQLAALRIIKKKYQKKDVLFDEVVLLDLKTGKDLQVLSLYDLSRSKKADDVSFKTPPILNRFHTYTRVFNTNWVHRHLNAITIYKDEIYVNDLNQKSFVLNKNFKIIELIKFPDFLQVHKPSLHDIQKISDQNYLAFKNFFYAKDSENPTFKIYEYAGDKIIFEFPIKKKDYRTSGFSGGVQKIGNNYLVGFPASKLGITKSIVGLISNEGQWIKEKVVNYRFQDIKVLPYADFLTKNQMK